MLTVRARVLMHTRIVVRLPPIALIACALVLVAACGREPVSAPSPPNTPLPAPAQPASTSRAMDAPSTLDELIFLSDVIARVTLLSAEPHVIVKPPGPYAGIKFRFQVIEYLKGSSDSELTVEVPRDTLDAVNVSSDMQSAKATAEVIIDARDRSRDSREAIVLLQSPQSGQVAGAAGTTTYEFIGPNWYPVNMHQYAITSSYNRAWLPASAPSGASGAVGSGEPEYFTQAPPSQAQGASGASSISTPTISLSEIKKRIKANDDLLAANRDMFGYEDCIKDSFRYDAYIRAGHIGQSSPHPVTREIRSGQPAGHRLWPVPSEYSGDPFYANWWTAGPDAHLFIFRITNDPDNDPTTGYAREEVTTRPVPSGVYKVFYKAQAAVWVPCDYNPELNYNRYEGAITVTAPAGTLHEAFFDPADIGTAVGSDADNGVLEPASFRLEGVGSVNINRIDWKLGEVEIELDPHSAGGFANHHVDFIALDGSISLRLDFDDAAEVERDGTRALSWNVCAQPWDSGDLLMLRMSASQSELTDVTNDGPCSPPQNLVATSTHDSVTLTWNSHDDSTVTGHRILRRLDLQETFTQFDVDGATTTTYVDTSDIQPATKYIYRVHAVNDSGLSDMARVAVTTLAPPPQNLAATSTHDSVTLTWDAPDDATVSGYRILRRQPGQDTFVQYDVSGAGSTTYVDTMGIEPGTRYIYRVHAVYPAGLSDVSRVTVTTRNAP